MSLDIDHILRSWPFKPGEINVRRIIGDDGQEKIQLRLDLGVLQMETVGRPDGQRPRGHESLLAWQEYRLAQHKAETGSDEGFDLSEEECEELRAEGVMYYHRYLAEFVLGDFASVARDTKRNLVMFDLCMNYSRDEEDRAILEQYRPYVMMMYARARAQLALKQNRPKEAMRTIEESIRQIQSIFERYDQEDIADLSTEISVLRALYRDIKESLPIDPREKIHEQLQRAIDDERYEDAASLRDKLDKLNQAQLPPLKHPPFDQNPPF